MNDNQDFIRAKRGLLGVYLAEKANGEAVSIIPQTF